MLCRAKPILLNDISEKRQIRQSANYLPTKVTVGGLTDCGLVLYPDPSFGCPPG